METESFDVNEAIPRREGEFPVAVHPKEQTADVSSAEDETSNTDKQSLPTRLQDASRRYVAEELGVKIKSGVDGRDKSALRRKARLAKRTSSRNEVSDTEPDFVKLYLGQIGTFELLTKPEEVALSNRIRTGREATARMVLDGLRIMNGVGPIYGDEEKSPDLLIDGLKAKDHFINANLRLVVSLAKRYRASDMPFIDLVQEGNMGLEHAVDMFDERKGFKFSTYASWWIKQKITRSIEQKKNTIRLPHRSRELAPKVMEAYRQRSPIDEIACNFGIGEDIVRGIVYDSLGTASLNEEIGNDTSTTRGDTIADPQSGEAFQTAENSILIEDIFPILKEHLEERELEILLMRQGILSSNGMPSTLEEISKKLHLTRERVRQLESRAISKLRHPSIAGRLGIH